MGFGSLHTKEAPMSALEEPKPDASKKIELPKPITCDQPRIGRNDPCPCGSGKKYKKCCGQDEE